jgi:hypothetical protein
MWESTEDFLDIDSSPELREAADLLAKAGDSIAEESLPLKKLEATCALKCFEKIRDIWSMSAPEKLAVVECVERCEEPMEAIGAVLEEERNRMLEATTNCLEKCSDDDDMCANRCISQTLPSTTVVGMVSRVRAKILAFKYA